MGIFGTRYPIPCANRKERKGKERKRCIFQVGQGGNVEEEVLAGLDASGLLRMRLFELYLKKKKKMYYGFSILYRDLVDLVRLVPVKVLTPVYF